MAHSAIFQHSSLLWALWHLTTVQFIAPLWLSCCFQQPALFEVSSQTNNFPSLHRSWTANCFQSQASQHFISPHQYSPSTSKASLAQAQLNRDYDRFCAKHVYHGADNRHNELHHSLGHALKLSPNSSRCLQMKDIPLLSTIAHSSIAPMYNLGCQIFLCKISSSSLLQRCVVFPIKLARSLSLTAGHCCSAMCLQQSMSFAPSISAVCSESV